MKIPKIKKLPSGSYFCRIRTGGRDHAITGSTYDIVYAEAVAYKAGIIKAKHQPERVTVKEAIERYIDDKKNLLSHSTLRGYKTIQRNRFQGLADVDASKITQRILQRAINDEAAAVSSKTVINALGLLRAALCPYAPDIKWDLLLLPPRRKHIPVILERSELARLFAAVQGGELELPVLLAAWLGLRRSEMLALTAHDFDKVKKTVTISSAVVPDEHHRLVKKTTKTFASTRVLRCPDRILALVPEGGEERILTRHPDFYRKSLRRICRSIDIPEVGLHGLRHTNASVMLSLNIADKYAMRRGGWSSITTMKNIYQHTLSAVEQDVDNIVDAFFLALTMPENGNKNGNAD